LADLGQAVTDLLVNLGLMDAKLASWSQNEGNTWQFEPGAHDAVTIPGYMVDPANPKKAIPVPPDGSHAVGLDYVPFDGYVAELHQGEAVLPAGEARAYRSGRGGGMGGGGGSVQIVVNSYGKNPHELIELIRKATKNGAL